MKQKATSPDHIIVGLDIGTSKICTVIGESFHRSLLYRGVHIYPTSGMRKGIIVNMEEMVQSIGNALKETETALGVEINSVYVSISGSHMQGYHNVGASGIGGREVTRRDVDRVLDAAETVCIPLDREVLHVIPAGYAIDGQNGIKNPLGMIGEKLEARVYVIAGLATSVQNLLKCCAAAGVEVAGIVFSVVASACAVLTNEEKELGVALVDIGGGTTDILCYKDGYPRHASVLPVGGNHFTNDVAIGLKIPVTEAERVKKSFGTVAAIETIDESEQVEIFYGGQRKTVSRRLLAEILRSRTDEFLDLVQGEIFSCAGYDAPSIGIVLTGGGALLNGLDHLAESVWGQPVRVGRPRDVNGSADLAVNPACATGAGLVLYAFDALPDKLRTRDAVTGIWGKMANFMKEIFKIKKGGVEYVRN